MKKADFIIVGTVLIVAGVFLFCLYFLNGGSGKYVNVEIDGKIVDTIELDKDFEKQYNINGGTNTLTIKDGKAEISQADCPDGICSNHMPIKRTGESIICLPHKMVVSIASSKDAKIDNEIDAVA